MSDLFDPLDEDQDTDHPALDPTRSDRRKESSSAAGGAAADATAPAEGAAPGAKAEGTAPPAGDDRIASLYATAREQSEASDIGAAIATYRQLLAREPTHVRARNNLALLLERRGDVDAALAELQRALEQDPDNVSVLCNRAAILSGRMRYEEAQIDLQRALRLDDDNAEVLTNLGILLCRRGRWREATEPLQRAAHLDHERAPAHYYLGEAYNHIDELPAALQAYETAASLSPSNWRAFKGIGIVLDRMGRPDEAAVAYARAREAQRR